MTNLLLEKMKPLVDETVHKLTIKKFDPDPVAGNYLSKIVSVMSSAYKRHGYILIRSLIEQLRTSNRFDVWEEPQFYINEHAERVVNNSLHNPKKLLDTSINYSKSTKYIKVDLIVNDKVNNSITAYYVKRGNGLYDSGKKRLLLKDILLVRVLLKSYAQKMDLNINDFSSFMIFYYGKRSVPMEFSLINSDLDNHFDFPILEEIEIVNQYFKQSLIKMTETFKD